MAEITLADLVAWEPRLRPVAEPGHDYDLERGLTWAVTVRASAPMLPALRGGELVLLPGRVAADRGVRLPELARDLADHRVAGLLVERMPPPGLPLPTLVAEAVPPELEGEINRLLTERRGDLYRAGTELERTMADLTTRHAGLAELLTTVTAQLGLPLAVASEGGAVIAASGPDLAVPSGPRTGWQGDRLAVGLSGNRMLWLGPVPGQWRALARLVGERVASAADAALARAAETRPRGPDRAAALASLLLGSPAEAATRAWTLGLPVDGMLRVALAAPALGLTGLERALAPLATVHDAGLIDDTVAAVVARRSSPPGDDALTTAAGRRLAAGEEMVWIALSGPVLDAARLPAAMREARYVAALRRAGLVTAPVARFDAQADLGAYQVLYPLWGRPELAAFAAAAMADLPAHDRRGALRRTLLTFLETGGSHSEAAARLGIHRNTLAYRLRQIAHLTGHDPTDPAPRLSLHLALLADALPPPPP